MSTKNKNTFYRLPILDGLEVLHAREYTQDFPLHTHPTFNITLILDQVFSTQLSQQFLQAPQGSMVITHPNEVHATLCDTKLGSSFFTFYIAPDVLKQYYQNQPVFFADRILHDQQLFQQWWTLAKNFNTEDATFETQMSAAIEQLVVQYAKPSVFSIKETELFGAFLNEVPLEKFSLDETAKNFGIDKFKFLRLFKQETGLTPNHYLILKRVEKSKLLLESSDDLLEIALESGFYDATHLCKHFKKVTGISPLAYKKA